ncbi:hypothetical protein RSOL_440540 [Rhizoctonia solani AG-3 Rhs1AP]|uniref:Protein kinase domain-containing protein n=1 Tax=Rhizoctonia solani AG-3 Rhs1AP TaxID=1086054 RepID=X8JL31_9AGAM|nr:hypothetical protein RSOL_440540 [Rhizoctonia solani AG-3 Rhs1AP]
MMLPDEAILKVYDRRFADGTRKYHDINPPTYEAEAQYAEYLRSDNVAQTEEQIDEQAELITDGDSHPNELGEHLAAILVKSFFENERTAYSVLSSLQGKHIPMFYGTTRFLNGSSPGLDTTVPGILVEFVPVNLYSDLNVLNSDVRLENLIVKPNGSEVVMIDFGHSRLRREDEGDQAWKRVKSDEDEEGCVGCVAHRRFGWNYVRSERYDIIEDDTGRKCRRLNPATGEMEDSYL